MKIRKWTGVLLVLMLVLMAAIVTGCGGGETDKQPAVDVANMPIAEYAEYLVNEAVGEDTNNDKKSFIQATGDAEQLTIEINASDNFSANMQKRSTLLKSVDVFKQAFTERADINSLWLVWYLDLVDQKGNESTGAVMRIMVTKENAGTINWDNLIIDNLPRIADKYWEHPLYRRE